VELTSTTARQRYHDLAANLSRTVVGLDFDGVLSPIVEDPAAAHIHPEAGEVLLALAQKARAVAVVTGRPARQALALGELDEVGNAIALNGSELYLFGQYGNERWSSTNRRIISPRPPHGLATFMRELPRLLRQADAADAHTEEKGLAVAVHTRQLADPQAARDRLVPVLEEAAARHDLMVEPGRAVVEVRASGMHKGQVVRTLVEELDAKGFLFAGDDLGDVEAFRAVAELQEAGLTTLLVCSASDEQSVLVPMADVVVPGPDGVLELLRRLTADAPARH
jgi:trehalose 6-phosphate phosphatase